MSPLVPTALASPHAQRPEEALAALGSSDHGLSAGEVEARLAAVGPNTLPRARPPGLAAVLLRQLRSPLIYILLAAGGVALVLRDWADAIFIFAAVVVDAVIGTVQEWGAERSAEALRAIVQVRARVVRDGATREIDAEAIVPGDIVLLEVGFRVPADARLLESTGLEVDEAPLTGESLPVAKSHRAGVPADAPLAERPTIVHAGTMVVHGTGRAVVVATGAHTQVGQIASAVLEAPLVRSPLLGRIDSFTKKIALGVLAAVIVLTAVLIARGTAIAGVFMTAVALAVSAVPEGLPIALTVALAIGARRMGRRKVIARRLVAVETLGSCTFIASDKTGTLTLNRLTAQRVLVPGEAPWCVTGEGVAPVGTLELSPGVADDPARAAARRLAGAAALCNDGALSLRDGTWHADGDAVDTSLLTLAEKLGVDRTGLAASAPRLAAIPFEAERQFAATLHRKDGDAWACVKGASERVLAMCGAAATLRGEQPLDHAALAEQVDALAGDGFRVLAIAAGPVTWSEGQEFTPEQLRGLVLLGLVGMIDPLRPEARPAVATCRRAGITVAMVTGDHPVTALAIARELGLCGPGAAAVTGPQFRAATERGPAEVDALTRSTAVFARIEPQQKLEIVRSLIRQGHFVAVTGDGANDAPALRSAHIGVAMGGRGTDVAREAADLILTDDNFASIAVGVEEGRIAYANVRKVTFLLVSTGAAEIVLFVLATLAGSPLPLLPAQILWLNLVTNGIQDVALAFEPGEGDELERPPRPPSEPIFDRVMLERTLISATIMGSVAFAAFAWLQARGWDVPASQNAVLLLMVLFENVQTGASRSETRSVLTMNPLRNRFLLVGTVAAQLVHIAALYTPGLRDALGAQPVSLLQWVASFGLALTLFFALELHKLARNVLLPRRGRHV